MVRRWILCSPSGSTGSAVVQEPPSNVALFLLGVDVRSGETSQYMSNWPGVKRSWGRC